MRVRSHDLGLRKERERCEIDRFKFLILKIKEEMGRSRRFGKKPLTCECRSDLPD